MSAESICPLQAGAVLPAQKAHVTEWQVTNHGGHGRQTCGYCGSLHPDDFMELVTSGSAVVPTDKNYKCYVVTPRIDAGQMECTGMGGTPGQGQWIAATEEHREMLDSGWSKTTAERAIAKGEGILITPAPSTFQAKFYFEHLSEAQRERFVVLLNATGVNFTRPGFFYVQPFFIGKAAKAS